MPAVSVGPDGPPVQSRSHTDPGTFGSYGRGRCPSMLKAARREGIRHMPKTIIVPLDGSQFAERALAPAHTLARQSGAALVLVMARLGGDTEPERSLQSAAATAGIGPVRTVVIEDRLAASAIPMLAGTEPDAVICMTTHGRSGPGHALFGSIAEEVLRRVDVPLVLVGPAVSDGGERSFEELVVCLDGSRTAAAILPVASAFARDLELAVWLVGVVDPEWRVEAGAAIDIDSPESAPLQHVARGLKSTGVGVNWETLHGHDPASSIVEFAATRPSPLLAMTTHGRTGLARVTTGSVTMSVVHRAPCPVLVLRSHGLDG